MTFPPARLVNTHASNVAEIFDSNLGPGADIITRHALSKIGLDSLESFYQRGQTKLNMPLGTVVLVKLTEKIFASGDRTILKVPIRKTCDELYRKDNKSIVWVETSGQINLNKTQKNTLPLGPYATGQGGFEFSGQVQLRRLEPYESPSGTIPKWISVGNSVQIPYTAARAKTMPPGSELEIIGEGCFNLQFEREAALKATGKKTISLLVQKLAQQDKVLVKLSHTTGVESSLGYQYTYDPQWSFGTLGSYFLEKLGFSSWFKAISGVVEGKRENNNQVYRQYLLDLSKPQHAEAYEELLSRFSTKKADTLSEWQEGGHHETCYEINSAVNIADVSVTLLKILESEKKSHLGKIKYQESKSVFEHVSKWFSKMSIVWEWISIEDPDKKRNKSYCHLTFNSPYAKDYFSFTDSLKIPVLKEAKKIFETHPKTDCHANIFFTEQGIQNIQNSSFDEAFEAYLGQKATQSLKRYGEIKNKWFFTRWYFWNEQKALEQQNPWLSEHSSEIQQAFRFAQKTNPFKGSLRKFSDIQSIISLMKLAQKKEILIHELSITIPGMALVNRDEGMIVHPEQEFSQQFEALEPLSSQNENSA